MSTTDKLQQQLSSFVNSSGNKYCAECNARQPRWASTNLGVFICLRCSGIHRSLGVHISKIKSVNLDTWSLAQIQSIIELGGNVQLNKLYEWNIPSNRCKPTEDSSAYTTEQFIRDKYERKLFMKRTKSPNKNNENTSESSKATDKINNNDDSDGYETASDDNDDDTQPTSNSNNNQHTTKSIPKKSKITLTPPKRNTNSKRVTNNRSNHNNTNNSSNSNGKQSTMQTPATTDLLPNLSQLDLFSSPNNNNHSVPIQQHNNAHTNITSNDINSSNNDGSGFSLFNESNSNAPIPSNGSNTPPHQPIESNNKPRNSTQSILDLFNTASLTTVVPPQSQYNSMPTQNHYGSSYQQPIQQHNMYVPPPIQYSTSPYQPQQQPPQHQQTQYNSYMSQQRPMMMQSQQPYNNMMPQYGNMSMQPQYGQSVQYMNQSQQSYVQLSQQPQPIQSHNDFFSVPSSQSSSSQQSSITAVAPVKDAFSDLANLSFGQTMTNNNTTTNNNKQSTGHTTNGISNSNKPLQSQQFTANDFSFI